MSREQDEIFFRQYSIVIGLLILVIIFFFVAAATLGENETVVAERRSVSVAERTRPVGEVQVLADETMSETRPQQETAVAGGGSEAAAGKQIYGRLCVSCHGTGLPGVPQLGDEATWKKRVAEKGMEVLYENAINGFTGSSGIVMPPKGGNPSLSDQEVRAAVDYMIGE